MKAKHESSRLNRENIWPALRQASFVLAVFHWSSPTIQILKGRTSGAVTTVEEALDLIAAAAEQRPYRTGVPSVPSEQLIREASLIVAVTAGRMDILGDRFGSRKPWIGATFATVEYRLKRAVQNGLASAEDTG